jgi:hypothetical protein
MTEIALLDEARHALAPRTAAGRLLVDDDGVGSQRTTFGSLREAVLAIEAEAASPAALDVFTVAKVLARLDPDHAFAPGEITWLTAERFAAEYAAEVADEQGRK